METGAQAVEMSQIIPLIQQKTPVVVVLGNEGSGLRTNVRNACTHFVKIVSGTPATDADSSVESLNVSVAGGIILHFIRSHMMALQST